MYVRKRILFSVFQSHTINKKKYHRFTYVQYETVIDLCLKNEKKTLQNYVALI